MPNRYLFLPKSEKKLSRIRISSCLEFRLVLSLISLNKSIKELYLFLDNSNNSHKKRGGVIEPEDLELEGYVAIPTISDAYVKRVNALNKYVSERGATLLIAAYPIAWHENAPSKEEYEKFEQELRQRLDCQVISDYTQYCFEPEYFFNTYLHLTDEGAKMRTELLIQDLKKYLEESDKK